MTSRPIYHDQTWLSEQSNSADDLLVILETMGLITDEQVTSSLTLESVCMRPECLIGHNQDLQNIQLPSLEDSTAI